VEKGRLLYAIVHDGEDTFDIIKHDLFEQQLMLLSSPDMDLGDLGKMMRTNKERAEKLLAGLSWYAHDTAFGYIKLFWMQLFDKQRPAVIPDYLVPNEHETLVQLSNGSGVTIALDTIARPFVTQGSLIQCKIKALPFRTMTLLANKKKSPKELTKRYMDLLSGARP